MWYQKSQAHVLCQYSPFSSLSQDTFFFFFLPIFNVFVCLFWIRNSYLRQNRRLEGGGGCFVVEMFWAGFLLPREAFVIKLYAHAAGWVRSRNYIKSVLWYAPLWGNKENLMLNILVFCSLVLFLFCFPLWANPTLEAGISFPLHAGKSQVWHLSPTQRLTSSISVFLL